jgi:nicotinamidase-related amidase
VTAPHDRDDPQDEPTAPGDRRPGRTALLIIDMLHDYAHEDGELLREHARPIVPVIAELAGRAHDAGQLVVWVNDNHGDWAADRDSLLEAARERAGSELVDPIAPHRDAPFIVKSRHSVFYGSPLEYLLNTEGIERLVLTGQVTEQCILYSALDAYLRRFRLAVAEDAVAAIDPELAEAALRMMARNMQADVRPAREIEL